MAYHHRRLESDKFIVYFQKYTNTYASVGHLAELYQRALALPDVIGISVGTRPDCLTDEALELLTTTCQGSLRLSGAGVTVSR
jgi:Predicted Fe-S oxidoreductase